MDTAIIHGSVASPALRALLTSTLGLTKPALSAFPAMESQSPPQLPGEAFFQALEVERTQALVDRDIEKIRRLHAPDYELISVPGRVMSLERYLSLMAQDVFYASWEHGPMRVQVSQGMAAVRYLAKITFPSGKVVECWHTDIYAFHAGTWRAVWSQGTQLPQDHANAAAPR